MLSTSEWVSLGHPDKVADYISSYLLDRHLEIDPDTRFAVEVQIKSEYVTLGGEITTKAEFADHEIAELVRAAVREVGYTRAYQERWGLENTICAATRDRQDDLDDLAASCDAIVVVGSPESANTQRLFRLAAARRPAFVVDAASQLRPSDFAGFRSVGLTAGASTPDSLVAEVEAALAAF